MPMWYFTTQNACDTAFTTLFRDRKAPMNRTFYISLTINTIQTSHKFHITKPIVPNCKSYHFTPWKLSNDDVKAITLPLKSYFFILKVPFFSRKSPFSLLVWIFSWTFFQPPNDKNVLFGNIFLFPFFNHLHPSVDVREQVINTSFSGSWGTSLALHVSSAQRVRGCSRGMSSLSLQVPDW